MFNVKKTHLPLRERQALGSQIDLLKVNLHLRGVGRTIVDAGENAAEDALAEDTIRVL